MQLYIGNNGAVRVGKLQSLFCWKSLSNSLLQSRWLFCPIVAVLVLLEVPLQQEAKIHQRRIRTIVAVLVLLEVPLQLSVLNLKFMRILSCSPCFAGSPSATTLMLMVNLCLMIVAVLVLLEVPLQLDASDIGLRLWLVAVLVLLEVPLQPESACICGKHSP